MDDLTSLNPFVRWHLEKLLDSNTTPEEALQSLALPCFSPDASTTGNGETQIIFNSFIKFIITRLPDALVDGIWEEILSKTTMFWRYFKYSGIDGGPEVVNWLQEALSTPVKCPNPYIRIKLFVLLNIFSKQYPICDVTIDQILSNTFMHTVCEIQPHCLYLSDKEDHLFDFDELLISINSTCCLQDNLQIMISSEIIQQIKNHKEVLINNKKIIFLLRGIQLVGIFAVATNSIADPKEHIKQVRALLDFFYTTLGSLVKCDGHIPKVNYRNWAWDHFTWVVRQPGFRPYVEDTVRNLTTAILKSKSKGFEKKLAVNVRDIIARDLNICTRTCDFPRLLLSRQIQGPKRVHQHSLLLENMTNYFEKGNRQDEHQPLNFYHILDSYIGLKFRI